MTVEQTASAVIALENMAALVEKNQASSHLTSKIAVSGAKHIFELSLSLKVASEE